MLEGYLLQGIAPAALAGKVLTAFKETVHDAAVRVVSRGCRHVRACRIATGAV
jgi:hypothetical protein